MDIAKARRARSCLSPPVPLCMYNLTANTDGRLPVLYFTELLAEALAAERRIA